MLWRVVVETCATQPPSLLRKFLSKLGGWVAHVSTTRHSITDLGSTKMEGKPICCENSFQICKVALKFGVNISDLSPHLTSKMLQKKNKNVHMEVASQCQVPDSQGESSPSCSHAAYAPVQRHPETSRDMLSFPKKSIIITNIHEQHLQP